MQFESTLRESALRHADIDFEKMHEIAKHLHDNPEALGSFAADPEAFVFKFNGYRVQPGCHLHVADENNNLIPAEEHGTFGAEQRAKWGRMEIRVGYKTTALVECM